MDALETLFTRRSIRKYTSEPSLRRGSADHLEAAMNAPSANNRQPWHFLVVDGRDRLDAMMAVHPYARMLAEAPIGILVVADTSKSPRFFQQDRAAATENLLAARALGFGDNLLTGVYPDEGRVGGLKVLFDIPEPFVPFALIALGHPAEDRGRVERWMDALVHRNTW